jgi:hypothetical protein
VETGDVRLGSTFIGLIGLMAVLPTAAVPSIGSVPLLAEKRVARIALWPSLTDGTGDNDARHGVTSAPPSSAQQIQQD